MTLQDLYLSALRDRYSESVSAFIEDAHKYEIGEISEKTGLQKCLVEGRIVWLLPEQKSGYLQKKMGKPDTKALAKSCKPAKSDGYIKLNGNIKNGATNYLNYMERTWRSNPVKSPFLKDAAVRLNEMSRKHLFETKGKPRPLSEIKDRAECLPFIRDILQRTGKPADHYFNEKGQESYSIVGRAKVNGIDRSINVIISRDKADRYFYLSVFNLK